MELKILVFSILAIVISVLLFLFVWNVLSYKYQSAFWYMTGSVFIIDLVAFLHSSNHEIPYFIMLVVMNGTVLLSSFLYIAGKIKNED